MKFLIVVTAFLVGSQVMASTFNCEVYERKVSDTARGVQELHYKITAPVMAKLTSKGAYIFTSSLLSGMTVNLVAYRMGDEPASSIQTFAGIYDSENKASALSRSHGDLELSLQRNNDFLNLSCNLK